MEETLTCEALPMTVTAPSELDDMDHLVRVYRTRVFRYVLLSIRDSDVAESITQDCFLRAYRARDRYRAECSVSTWLIKIATNLIRDHTRRRGFQFWKAASVFSVDLPGIADRLAGSQASPETRLVAQDKLRCVWQIVDSLSKHQKKVFLLRFIEEMEITEIAEVTGMKINTVKSHLHRALSAVRAGMSEAGL
jgi:RNA polymerase sigma-70 factor, ECF subfamily